MVDEMGILTETLARGAEELGIELTGEHLEKFEIYYKMMAEANKKINLTSFDDERGVAVKHFIDSLTCLKALEGENLASLADVGSGAGFPGIPLKICRPELHVALIESQFKKAEFLERVAGELGLKDVVVINARAEIAGREERRREYYALAVARALAGLNVLAEYCLPLVRKGGYFLAMKGKNPEEEIARAQRSIEETGGRLERVVRLRLPLAGDERNLVLIKKIKNTPARYPRRTGIPQKRPL
ncbi:MAG TPA: 16S rRNA (guanine(527)-N(7))-methyltransferase RsmG [Bacillota bacterium]|nr:16S rRNA (guanine(527)-N(7))-methyltransferase RsmG [Bacillota bacterium]